MPKNSVERLFCRIVPVITLFTVTAACKAEESSSDFFSDWFARVTRIQSEQPAWMTPIFTTTPRLDQEVHYDQSFQNSPAGQLVNYGSGKGLELIPYDNIQVNISLPSYLVQHGSPHKEGWADESFLLKYRLLSANEQEGNYVLTTFLGFSAPTGSEPVSAHHYVYTPTIAGGKGWGRFDFQSTFGVSLPDTLAKSTGAGTPLLSNTALQYKLGDVAWPNVEFNQTYFPNGQHRSKEQLFIAPGLIFGRFPVWKRLRMVVGAGYQVAVTSKPLYHTQFDLTVRFPF